MTAEARGVAGDGTSDPRRLAGVALADALRDSRATTLRATFADDDWTVPQRTGLNPIAWELAHLAWFAEFWILRGPHALGGDGFVHAARPARIGGPDAIFDSARLRINIRGGKIDVVDRKSPPPGKHLALTPHAGIESIAVLVNGTNASASASFAA